MSKPLKLFFLATEDWYFISHRLPLALAAKAAGFEVAVITRCGSKCSLIREAGIDVIPFEMARKGLNPVRLLREIIALSAIYRRFEPDIVHHVALRPVVVGGIAARLAGISRVVSAIAGLGFSFADNGRQWLADALLLLLRQAVKRGLVIVQNPEDQTVLLRLGVAQDRLALIPGAGVDTKRFAFCTQPTGMPVVMLPSRLLWDKGVEEFVNAARRLQGLARFVLVGAPDEGNPACVSAESLEAWILERAIEWWGHQDDMPKMLAAAHIVCLPSYREGLPKVLLEAAASGRAVVTTDTPGCRDAIEPGKTGLLVPVKNAMALAYTIQSLLENPDRRRQMGEAGRKLAERKFAIESVVEAHMKLYQELLSK